MPRICLYADEVSPGNQLRHESTRKIQILHWAFKQGPGVHVDQLWFTLGLARSDRVNKVKGGMSAFVKAALMLFVEPHDVRAGFQIRINDETYIRFANWTTFIADENALKEAFDFKGASGIHCCPMCVNIVTESSDLHHWNASLRPSTCINQNEWILQTNNGVRDNLQFLTSRMGAATKKQWEDLTKTIGWNLNPYGLLGFGLPGELDIQPISMIQFDYMHILIVSGVWNHELGALLPKLKQAGFSQADLHEYLQGFKWPKQQGSHAASGKNIFRKQQSGHIKCSASEALGVFGVVRLFLSQHMDKFEAIRDEVASYMKLCEVFDVIQACKNNFKSASDLHHAIHGFVTAHLKAWGSELWLPKHHYLQHLPWMLHNHSKVMSCFVHERKHRVAKRFAENLRFVGDHFDTSILKDVIYCNIQDLGNKEIIQEGIVKPVDADPALTHAIQLALGLQAGDHVQYGFDCRYSFGALASADDFVLFTIDGERLLGQVQSFIGSGREVYAHLRVWKPQGHNMFKKSEGNMLLCEVSLIEDVVTYTTLAPDKMLVVPTSLHC